MTDLGGDEIGEYLFILLPLVALLLVHFALAIFIGRRNNGIKRLILLSILAVATQVVWIILAAGVIITIADCSGCPGKTDYESFYDATIGLPITLYYVLSPNLPDVGAWGGAILYVILPVALVLFLLDLAVLGLLKVRVVGAENVEHHSDNRA